MVKDSLSPEWDETFDFAVEEPSQSLYVVIFDQDYLHDQFLGKINVQLEGLMHRKRVRGGAGGGVGGSSGAIIHAHVSFVRIKKICLQEQA